MPIIRMARDWKEASENGVNVRLYQDYYRHTTISRFSDGTVCGNLNPQIPIEEQPKDGYEYTPLLYLYDTHVGLCIRDYERNGYDDSDWYMVVWNEELGKPESIEFASTRGWSYPCYGSRPDATPEVLAKYEAYETTRKERERKAWEERQARIPTKGKTLKVVKGRKVKVGTVGQCIWIGESRFGVRVGIKDESNQVHWTAVTNVEVVL